jgi:chitodextrinase
VKSHRTFRSRAKRRATMLSLVVLTLPALSQVSAQAAATPLSNAVCGTWVLQQVSGSTELRNLRTQIDAALSLPGVVGLSLRFPWKSVDTSFALLDEGVAIARAKNKAFSIRFMAGRHTPTRVFDQGSPFYMKGNEKVPAPFYADGRPNDVFERNWDEYVGRLATWSRANGVKLLHLAWYGQDWAELNNGVEVRGAAGYTQTNWTNAHKRLVEIGARHSGADLAVEVPLSGYGPLSNGPSAALADHIIAQVGAGSDRFFFQANGWGPNGDWGAPSATVEADFDKIWQKSARGAEQMIQPQDYDWAQVYRHLYTNDAGYAEVYLPSFNMANKAGLASEIKKFSDSRCTATPPPPGDTTAPTVSVTAPTGGQRVANTVAVSATASDNVGVSRVDVLVDGVVKGSANAASTTISWDTTTVADGPHTLSARGVDAAGNVGTSPNVAVTVDNTAPGVPAGLSATPGDTVVTVSFSPVNAADLAGYDLRTKATSSATWGGPVATTATSRTFTGLANGTAYDFQVRSRDTLGNASAWSPAVSATPAGLDTAPPTVPSGLTASERTRTSVKVCWNRSTDNKAVAGYYASVNSSWVATTTSTCQVIGDLRRNTRYTIGVRAFDGADNTSAAATLQVRTRS